ncbi:MAG: hypothetical protein ABIN83_05245 [Sphingomicrobium sp.]
MPRRLIMAGAALLGVSAALPAYADSYNVEFVKSRHPDNKGQYRVAKVAAEITPSSDGVVGLFRNNDDVGLPNGWSTFLYRPTAKTADGKSLPLVQLPGGRMHVEGWVAGPIAIEYSVLLQHDRFPSDPGQDELAYARDFGVMWTGRALLMEGAPAANIDIRFVTPKEWAITTPWRTDPSDPRHFTASTTNDLLDSAIMAGTQEQFVEPIGTAEARIGVDPALHDKVAGLKKTLKESIGVYRTIFGDAPRDNVAILLSGATYTGGGVMGRSISFVIGPDYPDPKDFHHVLSHELFHLWTGHWNRTGFETETEWLVEGSAEYYSYLSGLRAGRVSETDFITEIADRHAKYISALQTTSIGDAGKTKLQSNESSEAVYSGGLMTLFTIDALIRKHSRNRHSLDDAIRTLNAQSKIRPMSVASLGEILSSYGMPRNFLEQYITHAQPLPVAEALAFYGLEFKSPATAKDHATLGFGNRNAAQRKAWLSYTIQRGV